MLDYRFGIEIEMTGLTRQSAAEAVVAAVREYDCRMTEFRATSPAPPRIERDGGTRTVEMYDGRKWKLCYDGSIRREDGGGYGNGGDGDERDGLNAYSVELVSPILTYDDMPLLADILANLKRRGAIVNESCGIHIHLDGAEHTPRSLRNWINQIHARDKLFYAALKIPRDREQYCERFDDEFIVTLNKRKPVEMSKLEDLWYKELEPRSDRTSHYNRSRYHLVNLHSFFHGHGTVELRCFNSTLDFDTIDA